MSKKSSLMLLLVFLLVFAGATPVSATAKPKTVRPDRMADDYFDNCEVIKLKGHQKLCVDIQNINDYEADSLRWYVKEYKAKCKISVSDDKRTAEINATRFKGKKKKAVVYVYCVKGSEIICTYTLRFK